MAAVLTLWAHPAGAASAADLPGGNLGFNAAVAKLFSDIAAFEANVETSLTNRSERSQITAPMRMYKSGDRFRIEVDLAKLKGAGSMLQGLPALENLGMARMTSLVLPEEKGMIVLFPELKVYTRVPLSEADLPTDGFKLAKKATGREKVNGFDCARHDVTLTDGSGLRTQATVWEAPTLKNFPVRMVFRPDDAEMRMDFKDVRLKGPAEELFRVPKDYKGFNSVAALLQEAMTRVLPSTR